MDRKPQTIQIFLPAGDPRGIRVAHRPIMSIIQTRRRGQAGARCGTSTEPRP